MKNPAKFSDRHQTAKGDKRAFVSLQKLQTLWFNTGTVCNLACANCYIESSPQNDRLSFLQWKDVAPFIEEIKTEKMGTQEIGFTGGEPFANPYFMEILENTLAQGFSVLILTNGYRAISKHMPSLGKLNQVYPKQMRLRISLDHHSQDVHEHERGKGTFEPALKSLQALQEMGIPIAVASRSLANEREAEAKAAYQKLFAAQGIDIDLEDGDQFVMFPEMDEQQEVPEITTDCWGILDKDPNQMMCASSRMVVKRKGEQEPKVLACTLLAYQKDFELGKSLKESQKDVHLNHPFCAQFCVLGGASCSG